MNSMHFINNQNFKTKWEHDKVNTDKLTMDSTSFARKRVTLFTWCLTQLTLKLEKDQSKKVDAVTKHSSIFIDIYLYI